MYNRKVNNEKLNNSYLTIENCKQLANDANGPIYYTKNMQCLAGNQLLNFTGQVIGTISIIPNEKVLLNPIN